MGRILLQDEGGREVPEATVQAATSTAIPHGAGERFALQCMPPNDVEVGSDPLMKHQLSDLACSQPSRSTIQMLT
jgi:hypothetical protein